MLRELMQKLGMKSRQEGGSVYRSFLMPRLDRIETVFPMTPGTFKPRLSGVPYLCIRQIQLQIQNKLVWLRPHTAKDDYTLGTGHAVHSLFQHTILPNAIPEAMLGWWSRADGSVDMGVQEAIHRGLKVKRPVLFGSDNPLANEGGDIYNEVTVAFPDLKLSGHPDMIVDWSKLGKLPEGVEEPLEVEEYKTISANDFVFDKVDPKKGGKPQRAHVIQVTGYMAGTGIERARIVYSKKGENDPNVALRAEWLVNYTHKVWDEDIVQVVEQARSVIQQSGHGDLRERHWGCTSANTWLAKQCPVRNECFVLSSTKKRPVRIMTKEERVEWEAKWK